MPLFILALLGIFYTVRKTQQNAVVAQSASTVKASNAALSRLTIGNNHKTVYRKSAGPAPWTKQNSSAFNLSNPGGSSKAGIVAVPEHPPQPIFLGPPIPSPAPFQGEQPIHVSGSPAIVSAPMPAPVTNYNPYGLADVNNVSATSYRGVSRVNTRALISQ